MKNEEAIELIRGGIEAGEEWADLGAGTGTFTRALAELVGRDGSVWAVDRDARAVRDLEAMDLPPGVALRVIQADFTGELLLPKLDGILMANALHFVHDQKAVLRRVAGYLRPGGRLVVVEYDRKRGNRWVPYPVPFERFRTLAASDGFMAPREIGRRRSSYQGEMYAAIARLPRLRAD